MNVEPNGELGDRPLTKRELALQKKGMGNLSAGELQEWIRLCERKEKYVRGAKKARRGWKASRLAAEERLRLLHGRREPEE
jgi:hypothetical protein